MTCVWCSITIFSLLDTFSTLGSFLITTSILTFTWNILPPMIGWLSCLTYLFLQLNFSNAYDGKTEVQCNDELCIMSSSTYHEYEYGLLLAEGDIWCKWFYHPFICLYEIKSCNLYDHWVFFCYNIFRPL